MRGASFSYKVFGGENRSDGKLAVISRLNIEVKKGEYVAFTGHSGCGKSTLLKLLMCLYPLDACRPCHLRPADRYGGRRAAGNDIEQNRAFLANQGARFFFVYPSAWTCARYSIGVRPYSLWKVLRKLL